MQASTDLPLLRLSIPSPKRTLVFDHEASSGDEDGENSNDDEDKSANQSGRATTKVATPEGSAASAVTPRMSRLLGDQATKSVVTSYFGELVFLTVRMHSTKYLVRIRRLSELNQHQIKT